jgi:hypothetical protein
MNDPSSEAINAHIRIALWVPKFVIFSLLFCVGRLLSTDSVLIRAVCSIADSNLRISSEISVQSRVSILFFWVVTLCVFVGRD